jgi:hypothetical protein
MPRLLNGNCADVDHHHHDGPAEQSEDLRDEGKAGFSESD